jgi:hypothetical protein
VTAQRRWRRLAAGTALLALAGCGTGTPEPAFFPLNPGLVWHYASTTLKGDERLDGRLSVHALSPVRLDGTEYAVRHTSNGTDYLIGVDAHGIFRRAKRTLVQSQPQPDPERRYVLKAPFTTGTTWSHPTPVFLVERRRAGSGDTVPLVDEYTVQMAYQIEMTGVPVEVAAGRFDGCLVVRGTAALTLFVDPDQGFVEVPVTAVETYCPGVGLVRLERREELSAKFFRGGSTTLELVAFEGGPR